MGGWGGNHCQDNNVSPVASQRDFASVALPPTTTTTTTTTTTRVISFFFWKCFWFWFPGFGYRISGFGYRISSFGCRNSGFWLPNQRFWLPNQRFWLPNQRFWLPNQTSTTMLQLMNLTDVSLLQYWHHQGHERGYSCPRSYGTPPPHQMSGRKTFIALCFCMFSPITDCRHFRSQEKEAPELKL